MNERINTISPADAARTQSAAFDYGPHFEGLEPLVRKVQAAARLSAHLAHECFGSERSGERIVSDQHLELLQFAAQISEDAADQLQDIWLEIHNAAAKAGWLAAGVPADQVPA